MKEWQAWDTTSASQTDVQERNLEVGDHLRPNGLASVGCVSLIHGLNSHAWPNPMPHVSIVSHTSTLL